MSSIYSIKPNQQVSPFLLLYIIHATQIGEGILNFERLIAAEAGYDSWIAVLLTGLMMTIILWIIWKLLNEETVDLIGLHQSIFTKWIGNGLTIIVSIYFLLVPILILRSYLEVIKVWLFEDLFTLGFAIILFLLLLYFIVGGFRITTGLLFISVLVTMFLGIFKYIAFTNANIENLLPIMNHSSKEILSAVKAMFYSFLGIELILIYAPFIRHFQTNIKWAIAANWITTFIYLFSAIAIFLYFSEHQLLKIQWPTLHLWKEINLPFVERFEYIGISLHFIAIIATACIYFWAGIQCIHRVTSLNIRKISIVLAIVCVIGFVSLTSFLVVEKLEKVVNEFGFYFLIGYLPLLFFLSLIKKGVKKHAKI